MLGGYRAVLGVEPPFTVGLCRERDHPVAQDDVRTALLGGAGERMRRAVRIERAFVRIEQPA